MRAPFCNACGVLFCDWGACKWPKVLMLRAEAVCAGAIAVLSKPETACWRRPYRTRTLLCN